MNLLDHVPPGQLWRFLLVGTWNTIFGYSLYALFTAGLTGRIPYAYIAASLLSSLISITVSFLGYKWFVFKTTGNYVREWVRAVMVYSVGIALGAVLLAPVVFLVTRVTGRPKAAPYIAGALLTCVNGVISFFGHKNISFRPTAGH